MLLWRGLFRSGRGDRKGHFLRRAVDDEKRVTGLGDRSSHTNFTQRPPRVRQSDPGAAFASICQRFGTGVAALFKGVSSIFKVPFSKK